MFKIRIEYDPDTGKAIKDGALDGWVDSIVDRYKADKPTTKKIATEACVDALRVKVKEREINHKDIVFIHNDDEIMVDKYGSLSHYPKGFCEIMDNLLEKLIGWGK